MAKATQNEDENRKEVLNLWWEYLKRSDIYKEYCVIVRNNLDKGIRFNGIKWPKKFKEEKGIENKLSQNMFYYHVTFGDVYLNTFNNWWRKRKITQGEEIEINNYREIEIYDFEQDVNSCIESFKSDKGREPTLQEFRDKFLFNKNTFFNNLYLRINLLTSDKTENLVKHVSKIVKEQRRDPYIRELRSKINLEQFSSARVKETYFKPRELERYLEIYDLKEKEGLTMNGVIEKMGKDSKDTDIRSIFHQDLKRAKKIIKNVESCRFPGDYQPKKPKD
jgi:hypothetical protein